MKFKTSTLIWVFVWSIFMGVTVGSIGLGAVFPSANLIAKPFVCPNGQMQLETQGYDVSPVETVTTLTWYCADRASGVREELGIFPMSLYAGAIYGLLLFAVIALVLWFKAYRAAKNPQPARNDWDFNTGQSKRNAEESERIRQQAEAFRDLAIGIERVARLGPDQRDRIRAEAQRDSEGALNRPEVAEARGPLRG